MSHPMTAEVNETCKEIPYSKVSHDFMDTIIVMSMYQYCEIELYIGSHMDIESIPNASLAS